MIFANAIKASLCEMDLTLAYAAFLILLVLAAIYVVLADSKHANYDAGQILPTRMSFKPRPQAMKLLAYPPGPRPHAHRAALLMLYRHTMNTKSTPTPPPRTRPPSPLSKTAFTLP
ncbi:hypothetical protein BS47DRAFT_555583 [Hydnum rufescens UP504]|uniref:Uncharacterized protein n=1 Tax=Hydnum rufescens UP504 TaxID=1448309 RepID=A0A9P6B491_9AGAM|nr:hypothetical protein BS47DRAFT_555583 [Hydnum rufescens UP504]